VTLNEAADFITNFDPANRQVALHLTPGANRATGIGHPKGLSDIGHLVTILTAVIDHSGQGAIPVAVQPMLAPLKHLRERLMRKQSVLLYKLLYSYNQFVRGRETPAHLIQMKQRILTLYQWIQTTYMTRIYHSNIRRVRWTLLM
jgi:hypothetical protein